MDQASGLNLEVGDLSAVLGYGFVLGHHLLVSVEERGRVFELLRPAISGGTEIETGRSEKAGDGQPVVVGLEVIHPRAADRAYLRETRNRRPRPMPALIAEHVHPASHLVELVDEDRVSGGG